MDGVGVTFTLKNGGMKGRQAGDPLPGRIEICDTGINMYFDGYGVGAMQEGKGSILFVEFYQGDLRFVLSPDINSEDVQIVSMEGASEENRRRAGE